MRSRKKVYVVAAVVAAVLVLSVAAVVAFTALFYPPVDEDALICRLKLEGMNVESDGKIISGSGFLTVDGHELHVDGENLWVYLYSDASKASNDSAKVSKDGYIYNMFRNSTHATDIQLEWTSPPHFYQSGKMIVLYVGNNTKITQTLEKIIGKQFAGS